MAAAVAARGMGQPAGCSYQVFERRQSLLPARLMAAGLVVGVLAVFIRRWWATGRP
ncbi:MAG: hypothetical protein ACLT8E_11270 [Akkermansia sp.]